MLESEFQSNSAHCVCVRVSRKRRKERGEEGTQPAAPDLKCEEPGCDCVGQTKTGLVNHVRQREREREAWQHGYGGTQVSFLRSAFLEVGVNDAYEILSDQPQQKEE